MFFLRSEEIHLYAILLISRYNHDKIKEKLNDPIENWYPLFLLWKIPLICGGASYMALRSFVYNEKIDHAVVRMTNRYGKTAIVHSTGKGSLNRHIASKMTLGKAAVWGVFPIQKYVAAVYQHQKALAGYQARADDLQASDDQSVM